MEISSRRNLVIISSALLVLLAAVSVWFFLFRQISTPQIGPQITQDNTAVPTETSDQIRVRHMELIKASLERTLRIGVTLPLPDNGIGFSFGDTSLGFQGRVPTTLFDDIGLNKLLDPKTGEAYFYALSADKKTYNIMALLDTKDLSNKSYGSLSAYIIGTDSDLFMLDSSGVPLITKKIDSNLYDVSDVTVRNKLGLSSLRSCLEIYNSQILPKFKSGSYTIDIDGIATKVFCDMQTEGGGWTLFYANNGHPDSPIQKSYVQMRATMSGEPILDFSHYDDKNLAGLLYYKHFTELGAKEVLIRNRTGDEKKWVKFSFSVAKALEWALGPLVLGKTDYGCIELPRRATWSLISDDKLIMYENLSQMMNHGGTSWGVSHEKYLCNSYRKGIHPHVGFYDSADYKNDFRARSNEVVGGKWGGENEYRYFLK